GRPDRRRQAEDVRRTEGGCRCLPRPCWGKRGRGTPLFREPAHTPGREFSTGVVCAAYAPREIVNLQEVRRGGQHPLIAGLSSSRPLHTGDMVSTMPPVPRSHYLFHKEHTACQPKHPATIATSAVRVSAHFQVRRRAPHSVLSPPVA